MKVIGAGFGRTGTGSLKAALELLGYGPCYRIRRQCSGLQAGGQADSPAYRGRNSRFAARRTSVFLAQSGRFCCSMYWRTVDNGGPPADPAK
ncbi:sulfotransferase [Nonomuraea sp. NPDC049129]|uniref:sulfotransferase n=1 Tax=Nonomuraea sp. NPDC049129 TaxID=3155272 RepID=UPI0033F6C6B8